LVPNNGEDGQRAVLTRVWRVGNLLGIPNVRILGIFLVVMRILLVGFDLPQAPIDLFAAS
jgi:hypothetical protein